MKLLSIARRSLFGVSVGVAFGLAAAEMAPAAQSPAPAAPPAVAVVPGAAPAAAAPASQAGDAPMATDSRIAGDTKRTRFIADLTAAVEMTVFTLPDPYRVVIDLPEVKFDLADDSGQTGKGLFSAYRYGLISKGKSRIVLDCTGPVKVDKSFVIPPANGQPARIVVDVVPTTREDFIATTEAYRQTQNLAAEAEHERTLTSPDPAAGNNPKPVVVLDPGHGGIDLGTRGSQGILEKDVALAFAKVLGGKLDASGHYLVFYTRTDDTFVALGDRVAFAQQKHADLFISIHANSFPGANIRGTTIYTVSDKASDQMAGEEANRENQSDALAGLDIAKDDTDQVKDILLDLTRRETRNFGVVFARNLVDEMKPATRMFKVPHQTANFKVLESPDFPSAMIELGFMTNTQDEKLLLSDDWRDKTADSVIKAIDGYFKTHLAQGSSP